MEEKKLEQIEQSNETVNEGKEQLNYVVKNALRKILSLLSLIPIKVTVQFSHSVMSDSLRPMDCSTPGLPVHHQLLEFTQTHVH